MQVPLTFPQARHWHKVVSTMMQRRYGAWLPWQDIAELTGDAVVEYWRSRVALAGFEPLSTKARWGLLHTAMHRTIHAFVQERISAGTFRADYSAMARCGLVPSVIGCRAGRSTTFPTTIKELASIVRVLQRREATFPEALAARFSVDAWYDDNGAIVGASFGYVTQ